MGKNEVMVELGSFITNTSSGQVKTTMYMEAKAFDKNEVKKDLYKSKNMAKFSHYVSGNLYYNIIVFEELYQFPIETVEEKDVEVNLSLSGNEFIKFDFGRCIPTLNLSEDLGTTSFEAKIKGSDLNRWIAKAIEKGEFIKIG